MPMIKFNFVRDVESDVAPLIFAINTMGDNLVGLELGVCRGDSFLTILHNCNNIKKLYGVDSWKPYYDYIKVNPDNQPAYFVDEQQSELHKFLTFWHLKYETDKSLDFEIFEEDTLTAVKRIADSSLDFIFFDAMSTEKQTYAEAMAYYPKIKKGGWFMGHDAECNLQVIKPIERIKQKFDNSNELVIYNNCFLFKV